MSINKWIKENGHDLKNKKVVIFGATGGIGKSLSFLLASFNAHLIVTSRKLAKCNDLKEKILENYPSTIIDCIEVDLSKMESVKECLNTLYKYENIDILIHNAGIYHVPKYKTSTSYNNIFQVNFISPYYITRELIPLLNKSENPKVVITSSLTYTKAKLDKQDTDYSNYKSAMKVYGNSKRFLTFSMTELFKNEPKIKLSITHPGITYTNINGNYSWLISHVIKYPMKIIFMSNKKACLSIIDGVFKNCSNDEIICPWLFDIWGYPKKKLLKVDEKEEKEIYQIAENIYSNIN